MKKLTFVMFMIVIAASLLRTPVHAQDQKLTVLCTPQEDWCVEMTKVFQEETGIQTSYVRLSSGEALTKIRATKDNPEYSVWWGGPADAYIAASNEGLLEAYASPSASVLNPAYVGEGNYWYGIYVGALGFCSNNQVLEELGVEAPTSWADLLNPKLKGNIAMAHPATSGTAFTAFWSVVTLEADKLEYPDGKPAAATAEASAATADASQMKGNGKGYGADGVPTAEAVDNAFKYFSDLNKNILQYTRSGAASGPMAGRGEIAVAIIFSHDCVKQQVEGFKDVLKVSFPQEGTGYEIGGTALIKGGAELEAARKFVDFALSVKGQSTALKVNSFQLPTNPETPISEFSVKLNTVNLVDYNFLASAKLRKEIVERFDTQIAPQPKE
jgi:iron(III) transport system substrate-binding protein